MMVFAFDQLLKIVAQCICVAECFTAIFSKDNNGLIVSVYAGVIGRNTIKTFIIVCIVLQTEFGLELQVINDFPSETSVVVECPAVLQTVIVIHRSQRLGQIHVRVVSFA